MRGWIGIDLDGTLAEYDGWKGIEHIGEPVPAMAARMRKWWGEGRQVKIFTARVSDPESALAVRRHIQDWLVKHNLPVVEVTNIKDFGMLELWDDRAIQIEPNTGRRMDGSE